MNRAPGAMPVLTGYRYSVFTRSLRIALAEKSAVYAYVECDPFDPADAPRLTALHPFGRVPVLEDGGFRLWETAALLDYVEARFDGAALVPSDIRAAARMRQVISIASSYVYGPLVRQAFSHGIFRPMAGEAAEAREVAKGLAVAPRVLDALDEIAGEGLVLAPGQICLGACHLWPMLDYFAMLPEAREMLAGRAALAGWMRDMAVRPSVLETRPDLSALEGEMT